MQIDYKIKKFHGKNNLPLNSTNINSNDTFKVTNAKRDLNKEQYCKNNSNRNFLPNIRIDSSNNSKIDYHSIFKQIHTICEGKEGFATLNSINSNESLLQIRDFLMKDLSIQKRKDKTDYLGDLYDYIRAEFSLYINLKTRSSCPMLSIKSRKREINKICTKIKPLQSTKSLASLKCENNNNDKNNKFNLGQSKFKRKLHKDLWPVFNHCLCTNPHERRQTSDMFNQNENSKKNTNMFDNSKTFNDKPPLNIQKIALNTKLNNISKDNLSNSEKNDYIEPANSISEAPIKNQLVNIKMISQNNYNKNDKIKEENIEPNKDFIPKSKNIEEICNKKQNKKQIPNSISFKPNINCNEYKQNHNFRNVTNQVSKDKKYRKLSIINSCKDIEGVFYPKMQIIRPPVLKLKNLKFSNIEEMQRLNKKQIDFSLKMNPKEIYRENNSCKNSTEKLPLMEEVFSMKGNSNSNFFNKNYNKIFYERKCTNLYKSNFKTRNGINNKISSKYTNTRNSNSKSNSNSNLNLNLNLNTNPNLIQNLKLNEKQMDFYSYNSKCNQRNKNLYLDNDNLNLNKKYRNSESEKTSLALLGKDNHNHQMNSMKNVNIKIIGDLLSNNNKEKFMTKYSEIQKNGKAKCSKNLNLISIPNRSSLTSLTSLTNLGTDYKCSTIEEEKSCHSESNNEFKFPNKRKISSESIESVESNLIQSHSLFQALLALK